MVERTATTVDREFNALCDAVGREPATHAVIRRSVAWIDATVASRDLLARIADETMSRVVARGSSWADVREDFRFAERMHRFAALCREPSDDVRSVIDAAEAIARERPATVPWVEAMLGIWARRRGGGDVDG